MIKELIRILVVCMTQGSSGGPPPPKSGPAPPVGNDVPIDQGIWILLIAAVLLIGYKIISDRKKLTTVN